MDLCRLFFFFGQKPARDFVTVGLHALDEGLLLRRNVDVSLNRLHAAEKARLHLCVLHLVKVEVAPFGELAHDHAEAVARFGVKFGHVPGHVGDGREESGENYGLAPLAILG